MTVKEAAERLGKTEQFIRIGLQQGALPFGVAVKMRGRYSYHISEHKLNDYLGGKNNEESNQQRGDGMGA